MKKGILAAVLLFVTLPVFCCTSIIISGRATADGRPLMLKHRDTGRLDNAVGYFQGPEYAFIGLVNADTAFDGEVWTGTNAAGFSIMNTASYNIMDDDVPDSGMDREGILMYGALGICATLADFEYYLDTLSRPLGVETNFGVIDAAGGAAYYEVNNHSWVKYNVNDIPCGYRVVTNFSESGRLADRRGVERYETATAIFSELLGDKPYRISHKDIFGNISRSFRGMENGAAYVIPRKITSASIVIEGVKTGGNPLQTVMWTILGYPPCGVAFPLMVGNGCLLPFEVMPDADGHSQLCDEALVRKASGEDFREICAEADAEIEEVFMKGYRKWISGKMKDSRFFGEYGKMKMSFLKIYREKFAKNE